MSVWTFLAAAACVITAVVAAAVPPASRYVRRQHRIEQAFIVSIALTAAAVLIGLDTGWLR